LANISPSPNVAATWIIGGHLDVLIVLPTLQDFDVIFDSLISPPISFLSVYLFFTIVKAFVPALSFTLVLISLLLSVLVLRLSRLLASHPHFSVKLAVDDHLLSLPPSRPSPLMKNQSLIFSANPSVSFRNAVVGVKV
jgi:hypothetical protein